ATALPIKYSPRACKRWRHAPPVFCPNQLPCRTDSAMRPISSALLSSALCCLGASSVCPGQTDTQVPNDSVVQRFPVAKNGDALLLPVTIQGKTHLFVLGIGNARSVFDSSLPLAKPL